MQKLSKTFGDYISCGRNVRGLTMRELAQSLNVDIVTLSKIEKNWRVFPKDRLNILANEFKVPYSEILKEFIKSDLVQQYGGFPNYEDILIQILSEEENIISLIDVINEGESLNVEFKSSLRYCLKNKRIEKYIEHSAIKNICAFLNSNGGKLIIGVADDKEILGLETTDFKTIKENDKRDAFLKHFDNLISKYFGNNLNLNLIPSFEIINEKTIALIDVLPYNIEPVFLKNSEKNNSEEFYIRRNASSVALTMTEFYKYSKERWG
nr:RNA-binding domain-containing protein [uncultured Carboxylicivirga sp.]